MHQIPFNSLKISQKLEKSGFSSNQAKTISLIIQKYYEENYIITKSNIDELNNNIYNKYKDILKEIQNIQKDIEISKKDIQIEITKMHSQQNTIKWILYIEMLFTLILLIKKYI